MKKTGSVLSIIMIFFLISTTNSAAEVFGIGWDFNTPIIEVNPTETINVWATLYNNSDPGFTFDQSNYGSAGTSFSWGTLIYNDNYTPNNPYDYSNLFENMNNISLAPGESIEFLYITLTPHGGAASPGTYSNLNWIYPDFAGGILSESALTIHVNSVPVPAAFFLFSSGLAGIWFVKKRKQ